MISSLTGKDPKEDFTGSGVEVHCFVVSDTCQNMVIIKLALLLTTNHPFFMPTSTYLGSWED